MTPENLFVVSDSTLGSLRDLRRRRDEQAFIAGLALLEHEERKEQIYVEFAGQEVERNTRLGALYHDLQERTKQCWRLVRASKGDEIAIAVPALRSLGLNPGKEELRIDFNNGVVMRLEAGAWVPRVRES